ncbi:hypothetical protein BCR44DRAFT_1446567 [Catenaria anguillulae PL171]|uniref:Uncharacterized protein n=1 Tax=Catenaria anguillulae PL171 TaxID=765915 RepID=A0A1Y2H619_9FUNG|nr:hypothetical protein BCR44DRAFT_1446567 [Catenaria anguillulae PL171]
MCACLEDGQVIGDLAFRSPCFFLFPCSFDLSSFPFLSHQHPRVPSSYSCCHPRHYHVAPCFLGSSTPAFLLLCFSFGHCGAYPSPCVLLFTILIH